jgi:hypothetical protein
MNLKVGRIWIAWSEHGHKFGWFGHTSRSVRVRGLTVGLLPLRGRRDSAAHDQH